MAFLKLDDFARSEHAHEGRRTAEDRAGGRGRRIGLRAVDGQAVDQRRAAAGLPPLEQLARVLRALVEQPLLLQGGADALAEL